MSKYPSTNIVYSGIEDKGLTVTILDEKKNKWTIWKKDYENKDQDSEAWATLQNYRVGESFGIEYGEKEESFVNREGKTINFTRRTIFKILPLVSHPSTLPPKSSTQEKALNLGHSDASGGGLKGDAFWEKQAYEKCCSLWIASMIREGDTAQVTIKNALTSGYFWDLFQAIKADGAKRFSQEAIRPTNLTKVFMPDEDLPVIQQEEIDVSDIPFN